MSKGPVAVGGPGKCLAGEKGGPGPGLRGSGVPGQRIWFLSRGNGEPWVTPEHRSNVTQVALVGDSSGWSSGEAV